MAFIRHSGPLQQILMILHTHKAMVKVSSPGYIITSYSTLTFDSKNGISASRTGNACASGHSPATAASPLVNCSACRATAYCGPRCQRAALAQVHKGECKAAAKHASNVPEAPPTREIAVHSLHVGCKLCILATELSKDATTCYVSGTAVQQTPAMQLLMCQSGLCLRQG